MKMLSVWINEEDKIDATTKIRKSTEDEPAFEDDEIEELYINNDGELSGSFQIEEVFVSIGIPFGIWFAKLCQYNSFEELSKFLEKNRDEVAKAIKLLEKIKKQIQIARDEKKNKGERKKTKT